MAANLTLDNGAGVAQISPSGCAPTVSGRWLFRLSASWRARGSLTFPSGSFLFPFGSGSADLREEMMQVGCLADLVSELENRSDVGGPGGGTGCA